MKKEKVLIVGGGFGGVKAALDLSEDSHFAITLLSDDPEFRYYPALYHTATGGKRSNSSIPLASLFVEKGVTLIYGTATVLDRKAKTIATASGEVHEFDTLIVSLGVVTNYFGIPGLPEYSYSIKTQSEVERFKAHLHNQLVEDKVPDLNYVIVGAGPTGIELAGALPSYLHEIMRSHGVKNRKIRVGLIEAAPRLLPRLPIDTARVIKRRLKRLGVRVYVGSAVQGQTADELTINGKPMRSHTVIWTAGVTNHPFFSDNKFVIMNHGKVAVNTYLQAEDNVYVLGDNANTPYSGTAQTALRDGSLVASNLRRRAVGRDMQSYVAKKPVTVIPVGKGWAAVCWGQLRIYGWLGWVLREAANLVGFHDLEPWMPATKQWASEFGSQDSCKVCAIYLASTA